MAYCVGLVGKEKTVILSRAEHGVSRRKIDPDALKVLYRLTGHDHTAYLVGGGVRDLLLGREPKDFDISTDAHPGEIKRLFKNCVLIGRRFRLAHIRFRGGKIIETSTFRSVPEADGEDELYHHRDNTFGSPEEDARRRDFTINGLFYDVRTFNVIDHVGGLADLRKRVVRCIGDPDVRFREDPVRMVRAVRFAARLGFRIERRTLRGIARHADELEKASTARLLEEIYKLFPFGSGEPAFRLLHETGLLPALFPELTAYLKRTPKRQVNLWRHLYALDKGSAVMPQPTPALLLGAALYCLYEERIARLRSEEAHIDYLAEARAVLDPIAARYRMPKKVYFALVHMFAEQRRFRGQDGRRFSRRKFAARESFPEALALYELDLAAHDEDMAALKPWKDLLREQAPRREEKSREERGKRRRRRRPRRRRR